MKSLVFYRLLLLKGIKSFGKVTMFAIILLGQLGFSQEISNFHHLNRTFIQSSKVLFDNNGYMWVSDADGLFRYDGYDYFFVPYTDIFGLEFSDRRSILFEKDTEGNFWLATFSGDLVKMTTEGQFVSYSEAISKLTNATVTISAIHTKDGFVWLGSTEGAVYKYDLKTDEIESVFSVPQYHNNPQPIRDIAIIDSEIIWISTFGGEIYKLQNSEVYELKGPYTNSVKGIVDLAVDHRNNLLISTEFNGLFSYNSSLNSFKQLDSIDENATNKDHTLFISLYYDTKGILWAGTDGYGLYKFDLEAEEKTIFLHRNNNEFSLSNNTITAINEDSFGNIWAVTKDGLVDILPNNSNHIYYYSGTEQESPSPALSILKSTDGSLWIGTDGFGLNRILPDGSSEQFINDASNKNTDFEGKYIQKIVEDSKANLWIGTYQNGLYYHENKSREFSRIPVNDASGEISSSDIRYLFIDSKQRIWATSTIGIHVFSENQKKLAFFDYRSNGLSGTISEAIFEDSQGVIWVGVSEGGLFELQESTTELEKSLFIKHDYFDPSTVEKENFDISTIVEGSDGELWLQSGPGFLIKYNPKTKLYKSYRDKENLKNIHIWAVLIDKEGHLWLSSTNGIHKYDPERETINSFYKSDGLQGDSFMRRSSFKAANGMLYFGGKNGVSSFIPELMLNKPTTSKLNINSIEILNKPAHTIVPNQLTAGIQNLTRLNLESDQSSFSFKFAAVGDLLNNNFRYAYRLKGFEEAWIDSKDERTATYTNIPDGDYTFEVKAGTKKGDWEVGLKQVHITIKPYWWESNVAIVLYLLGIFGLIYGTILWVRLRNRLHREEWQYNQEKNIYALKMNFFTKMSHEIQTPLTLISGPIEDMLLRATATNNQLLKKRLSLIKNNTDRLSRISNELLNIKDKELGQLRLRASKNNIIEELKKIALSFSERAAFKNIRFEEDYPSNEIMLWYDREKVEHMFYNLLSNAFKFTPVGGKISLTVSHPNDEVLQISISDSGPGIPEEEFSKVFELFYQSETGRQLRGSGIGLALTKEMVELHHGKIHVTSTPQIGTCFTLELLTGDHVFSEEEKRKAPISTIPKYNDLDLTDIVSELKTSQGHKKGYEVLIVEDNIEMQIFLQELFEKHFKVRIAEDGKKGMAIAEKHNPNLIISDIMMPIMDGIEMCNALKKNKRTNHIPIILLTAKNTTGLKLTGLKSGAVAYIQKPFSPQELLLKANNLIIRHKRALTEPTLQHLSVANKVSKQESFKKKLIKELTNQLENTEFKLEDLSEKMHMSYSVIYRNCQEITGKTLVDFFRSLKLKHAMLLIIKHEYNISEAAYMVGYKDPKYFTKCFKVEFGKSPSTIKQESKKIGVSKLIKKYEIQLI